MSPKKRKLVAVFCGSGWLTLFVLVWIWPTSELIPWDGLPYRREAQGYSVPCGAYHFGMGPFRYLTVTTRLLFYVRPLEGRGHDRRFRTEIFSIEISGFVLSLLVTIVIPGAVCWYLTSRFWPILAGLVLIALVVYTATNYPWNPWHLPWDTPSTFELIDPLDLKR